MTSTRSLGRRPVAASSRGISLASAAASDSRSTVWMTSNNATASRALLLCRGPMRWSSTSGKRSRSAGHLALASWTRFSPKTRWPASSTGRISSAGNVLETATNVTSEGSRPSSRAVRAIASRTAASRVAAARPELVSVDDALAMMLTQSFTQPVVVHPATEGVKRRPVVDRFRHSCPSPIDLGEAMPLHRFRRIWHRSQPIPFILRSSRSKRPDRRQQ
ncbi:hypothetical protein CHELA1G2_14562 [Hyphomicrobiales bacterium]|nr:hypothetical protein CHELA1G2_14562 [Hyphomicrobiales bacterium]